MASSKTTYKVTDVILKAYSQHIKDGCSKAEACRRVGIAPTTMSDHLKRIASQRQYIYSVMKRAGVLLVMLDDNTYFKVETPALLGTDKEFITGILNRDTYVMNQTEVDHFGVYKKGFISDITSGDLA